ncbi:glycoside hydrolase family 32 protein [Cellulomonas sp. URHD0024]|uniref:glycoside hydrolase family 32 protein n=1 Tax=Cellulomonas sp. URHD0024 TaxID=1302620 RepID=UPI0003F4C3DB|nr:glycoside hydrolase family 32 protein [Cellulomonas sp. URHD0024]
MGKSAITSVIASLALAVPLLAAGSAHAAEPVDPYRPQVHFAPEKNWINDPNGPVWYQGKYHMFFQHNPEAPVWGNMSWGHAVSTDLVHWEERPVAIPHSDTEAIFSGSVVVDSQNTSGFGTKAHPALVAVYTSYYEATHVQAQSLAYSTDAGETWTKYQGNPVLDLGSTEFRDPKVFWYGKGGYWVMAVALSAEHKIQLYRSDNLKSWTHLSDFGPANAVGGVWEMPDLFELPVDGRKKNTKWVMVVNLNPGSIAGGSGAQYFVGNFDGTQFTADNVVTDLPGPPPGDSIADFEQATYPDGWSTTGTAFGSGPVQGSLPGQNVVSGYEGSGLVNSFVDFDSAQGTLTSPAFTVNRDYVNLLVGGGFHPREQGAGDGTPPTGTVFEDFEHADWGAWTATGDAWGSGPTAGNAPCQGGVSGFTGALVANSFHNADPAACGDQGTGTLTSPPFAITSPHINFQVGGGAHEDTAVRLLVNGQVVRSTSGRESETLNWASWDVSDLIGTTAQIELYDANTGGWGHVSADQFMFSDAAALPVSTETTVNLVVDGQTVRTATGSDSETLNWVSWKVSDLKGKAATLQIVDRNSSGWGHILADQVTLADAPVPNPLSNYDWVDFGKDNYAAQTFSNVPDGRRISVAWMNNWQYAGVTPTGTWRGSMSIPRELGLRTIDGKLRLTQTPVKTLNDAATARSYTRYCLRVRDQVITLPKAASGATLKITADFQVGSAKEFGLYVRSGADQKTVVGYDRSAGSLFVDRTNSGADGFHPAFAGVQSAPLASDHGHVRLTVVVDRSSVEVFGGAGQSVITDLIYPDLASQGVAVYAKGGDATLTSLTVTPLG